MGKRLKGLFLTHDIYLNAPIPGGVQICSQEFFDLVAECGIDLKIYSVGFTRGLVERARIRMGLDCYNMFNVKHERVRLIQYIRSNAIDIVFLNMAGMLRFAKMIKESFAGGPQVILFSHGNNSVDLLHRTTKPLERYAFFKRIRDMVRLGVLIHFESRCRMKYLDGVITVSETEEQIEKWLGAQKVIFLPRVLKSDFVEHEPDLNRIGFVGRLDHPPNYQGLVLFLEELKTLERGALKVRLVGAPAKWGRNVQRNYSFVEYLGELSDSDLRREVQTWSFFLNPIFWYSAGCSFKLGKAIGWGLPVVTTLPGLRGYQWNEGSLLVADDPRDMALKVLREVKSLENVHFWASQTKRIAQSGISKQELAKRIRMMIVDSKESSIPFVDNLTFISALH